VYNTINEIRLENEEVEIHLKEISDLTTSFINKKYPDFFSNLKVVMESDNYFEIEKIMNTSSKMIEQAIFSSDKFSGLYKISKKIREDESLMNEILELDMTTEKGIKQLTSLLSSLEEFDSIDNKGVCVVVLVALVYLAAAAVNTVLVAYYAVAAAAVVVTVAFWIGNDKNSEVNYGKLSNELLIADLGEFFKK